MNLGPEFTRLGFLAEELGGDPSFAMWVAHSGRLGYPFEWINSALRRCPKEKLRIDYLSGILRNYEREGGPPKGSNGPCVASIPDPVEVSPEWLAERRALAKIEENKIRQMIEQGKAERLARQAEEAKPVLLKPVNEPVVKLPKRTPRAPSQSQQLAALARMKEKDKNETIPE